MILPRDVRVAGQLAGGRDNNTSMKDLRKSVEAQSRSRLSYRKGKRNSGFGKNVTC